MVYTKRAEMAAVSLHQPCQRCKYTTSVDIQKRAKNKNKKTIHSPFSTVFIPQSSAVVTVTKLHFSPLSLFPSLV